MPAKNNIFVYDTFLGKTVERYCDTKNPQYKAMKLAEGYCEGKEKPVLVNISKNGVFRYAYETNTDFAVIFYPDL